MLKLSVLCPEGPIYEGEADMLMAPGLMSNFSVLKDHAPLVSELDVGIFTIYTGEKEIKFSIEGGFIEVCNNSITALIERVLYSDDINVEEEKTEFEKLLVLTTTSDVEYAEKARNIKTRRVNIRLAQQD